MAIIKSARKTACTLDVIAVFRGVTYHAVVWDDATLYDLRLVNEDPYKRDRKLPWGTKRFLDVQEAIVATEEVQSWIRENR
jgi:hypothetical protein